MEIDRVKYFESMCENADDLCKLKLHKNLCYLFDDVTNSNLDKIAIEWKDGHKDFKGLREDVFKARSSLQNLKLNKSDNIGLVFKNEYDFVVYFFASITLGLVAACIPDSLPSQIIFGVSKKFNCKKVIVSNMLSDKYNELSKIDNSLFILVNNIESNTIDDKLCFELDENHPACIVFTGGTTGNPKGAVLSHKNLCRGAINGCYVPNRMFNNKYVSLIPFTHIFGLVRNLLSTFLSGSTLYIISNPLNFISEMPIANPDALVLTPGLAKIVLTVVSKFGKKALGNKLSFIIAGGAPVPSSLINDLLKYDIKCYPGYGSTESTNLVSGNGTIPSKASSVGIPYVGQEVIIKDGEVLVKGDNVFLGYYQDKDKTNEVLKDGYLYTGDLGYFDEDGFLYITGRKNNLIVLQSGLKISPEEIEEKINKCKLINDSIVFCDNSIITAEVYLIKELDNENNRNVVKDFILNTVNKDLEEYSKIQNVVFRDKDFKRSPAMKIIREHK